MEFSFIRFELGVLTGALPLACVREILPMVELARPPQLAAGVEGLVNVGGTNYPVLRLDHLLDVPDFTPNVDSHLILTRNVGLICALVVGRAVGVDRVRESDLGAVASFVTRHGSVRAQYSNQVHVIDLEKLLEAPSRGLKVVA